METLIFATNNQNKVDEIRLVLGSSFNIITLKEAGIDIDIPEPHDTLEANASEKSGVIHNLTHKNCFSEDTGLEVEALNGEPGVKSARYAGEGRSFENNIERLLENLKPHTNKKARFRTVISLILNDKEYLFEGICQGAIIDDKKGRKRHFLGGSEQQVPVKPTFQGSHINHDGSRRLGVLSWFLPGRHS